VLIGGSLPNSREKRLFPSPYINGIIQTLPCDDAPRERLPPMTEQDTNPDPVIWDSTERSAKRWAYSGMPIPQFAALAAPLRI
jgi:hypothetical protein